VRLNRFLASAGLGSRRHCDELIAAGRVTINGQPTTNFGIQVRDDDHVKVDHRLVRSRPILTIMLHKPAGFVSTRRDPHATDTIYDLLPPKFSRLFNVGRLDAQSEGLLLLTSDGELAQQLTHPRFKIEKEYEVTLDKLWNPALAEKLRHGIFLDGKRAQLTHVQQFGPTRLRVTMHQGLNRQIRRMFYELGYEVKRLVRTRLGALRLGNLPRGEWRGLPKSELALLSSPGKAPSQNPGHDSRLITPNRRAKSPRAEFGRRRGSRATRSRRSTR
jgi:23S rRNA pseudouridine2605 synthase